MPDPREDFTYDVCLSFSGKQRALARDVADELKRRSVRVFYDDFERVELWGKDLAVHLHEVYERRSRYVVPFLSADYAASVWTRHEWRSALSRALTSRSEYILPVRIDHTPMAGWPDTVAFVDMNKESPRSLADLICRKIGLDPGDEVVTIRWAAPPTTVFGDPLVTFQGVAVRPTLPGLERLVGRGVRSLAGRARRDGVSTWWTTKDDRRFDRLYATSTVAVTLGHLGVGPDGPLLGPALEYLRRSDAADLDERAGPMGLLSLGLLDAASTAALIGALAARQIPEGSDKGSFKLFQGPSPAPDSNWTPEQHSDGAAFHACHVADLLLHIPADQPDNRLRAEPLLTGLREFLRRTMTAEGGLLRDPHGRPTQRTLYAYALSPMLSLPLPGGWREIAHTVLEAVAARPEPTSTRCFAMMNCTYLAARSGDPEFGSWAAGWVTNELEQVVALIEHPDPVTSALALRAVAYGVELIDPRLGGYVRAAGRTAAGS